MKARFVFKQKDLNSPDLTFVEVEDTEGRSIRLGEWSRFEEYTWLTIDFDKADRRDWSIALLSWLLVFIIGILTGAAL